MKTLLVIDLPVSVKDSIYQQFSELERYYRDFNWTDKTKYRIVLHDFGELKWDKAMSLRLSQILFDQPSFHMYSVITKVFIKNNITINLGFRRSKELESLVDKIRGDLGMDIKTKFVPYLTLAHYRIPSKQQYFVIKKRFEHLVVEAEFLVKKIILIESNVGSRIADDKIIGSITLI